MKLTEALAKRSQSLGYDIPWAPPPPRPLVEAIRQQQEQLQDDPTVHPGFGDEAQGNVDAGIGDPDSTFGKAMGVARGLLGMAITPIGVVNTLGNVANHFGANSSETGPAPNPAPSDTAAPGAAVGPASSSPAGGAQAAAGHAPGTGVDSGTAGSTGSSSGFSGFSGSTSGQIGNVTGNVGLSGNSVGGSSGGGAGSTVICTELYAQGYLDPVTYMADQHYGEQVRTFDPKLYAGYMVWAPHVVRAMQKSEKVSAVVAFIARPWAKEMAYRMGERDKGSVIGKIMMLLGYPLCRLLG